MANEFVAVFEALKGVLEKHSGGLAVQSDTATNYTVAGKVASPFPQHKGRPMAFGAVLVGKAYVSYHLPALYMNPELDKAIGADLKKRMQGKACFNFKKEPEAGLLNELSAVTKVALADWQAKKWV
jgi:hypothetical protein